MKLIKQIENVDLDDFLNLKQTMTSLEISQLVQNRHDKVKQSIERLVKRGVIGQPPMGNDHYVDKQGKNRTIKVYKIAKRDTYVIVAQLSPEFTGALVDRWIELEQNQNSMTAFINKFSNLENKIKHNGSVWGAMGVEQRKNKKAIESLGDNVISVYQRKLL